MRDGFFTVVILKDSVTSGFYQQIEFWESDYLIGLTFCENYFLEVWNWRTQTQLVLQRTDFLFDDQYLM